MNIYSITIGYLNYPTAHASYADLAVKHILEALKDTFVRLGKDFQSGVSFLIIPQNNS